MHKGLLSSINEAVGKPVNTVCPTPFEHVETCFFNYSEECTAKTLAEHLRPQTSLPVEINVILRRTCMKNFFDPFTNGR
jgi:hypothetical protein